MDNDDLSSPVIGRRQILRSAGALGVMGLIAGAAPLSRLASAQPSADLDLADAVDDAGLQAVCSLTPSATPGPFYLDLDLLRTDITEGLPGIPTRVFLQVVRASDCAPIPDATVDVWHCDAAGRYSGFPAQGTGGETFLRGIQITGANGLVSFDTIYPGWYTGRTTHIHLKVRPTPTTELTTQLYFKQQINARVNALPPYSGHGPNPTTNAADGLFLPETIMTVLPAMGGRLRLSLVIAVTEAQA